MGTSTIFQNGKKNSQELIDFFRAEFSPFTIIDYSIQNNTAYLAIQTASQNREIHAYVVLFSNKTKELSYKVMHESNHPFSWSCPKRILNKLSPIDNEYALAWRKRCSFTKKKGHSQNID